MSAVSGIFIFFNSCSEDDGAAEIFEEINATQPSSIVLKNIPAGTLPWEVQQSKMMRQRSALH